jgi:hypothetical protein
MLYGAIALSSDPSALRGGTGFLDKGEHSVQDTPENQRMKAETKVLASSGFTQ